MKTFIYMNHFIKNPGNEEPVIVVQRGGKRVYAEEVGIFDSRGVMVARVVTGDVHGAQHDVKVHVEVVDGRVEVLP